MGKNLSVVSILVTALAIIGSEFIYKKRIANLKAKSSEQQEKLNRYTSMMVTHFAICEFLAILGIIGFMFFGVPLFFLGVGMSLVEMLKKYPTQKKINAIVETGFKM